VQIRRSGSGHTVAAKVIGILIPHDGDDVIERQLAAFTESPASVRLFLLPFFARLFSFRF
jgi:hypothetical protein